MTGRPDSSWRTPTQSVASAAGHACAATAAAEATHPGPRRWNARTEGAKTHSHHLCMSASIRTYNSRQGRPGVYTVQCTGCARAESCVSHPLNALNWGNVKPFFRSLSVIWTTWKTSDCQAIYPGRTREANPRPTARCWILHINRVLIRHIHRCANSHRLRGIRKTVPVLGCYLFTMRQNQMDRSSFGIK